MDRRNPNASKTNLPETTKNDSISESVLPKRFSFYHFGAVETITEKAELHEIGYSPFIVLFRLTGDQQGYCVVGFDQYLTAKASMMIEMANILVAKLANFLSDTNGLTTEISPPTVLDPLESKSKHMINALQSARSTMGGTASILRTYQYRSNEKSENAHSFKLKLAYLPEQFGES